MATEIESQIEGEFNGWDGDARFKLVNGQTWEQVHYRYRYFYRYRPRVRIFLKNGQHHLQVDGDNDSIVVRRVY